MSPDSIEQNADELYEHLPDEPHDAMFRQASEYYDKAEEMKGKAGLGREIFFAFGRLFDALANVRYELKKIREEVNDE